jgi:hypothetical protein
MDIQTTARLSALELLTTELLSAHLLTVPDPESEVTWAIDHLRNAIDAMPIGNGTAKEMATLRAAVKDDLNRILKAALAQAKQVGRQRWDVGIAGETKA